jgi:hypothetical protein
VILDFGSSVFNGQDCWLEIAVRTNLGGAGTFTALSPRQKLTPTPYAITAGNAASLGGLGLTNFWKTTGNSGTTPSVNFIGTTDFKEFTVRVADTVALQFIPGSTLPNVVGGLAAFHPSVLGSGVSGAVIAGGNAPSGSVNGFGGGDFMAVYDDDGAVGGGFGNKVGSNNGDTTDAAFATVSGGVFNSATKYAATVGGGDGNLASGLRSVVGGGYGNVSSGSSAMVPGGESSVASGSHSFAAGNRAKSSNDGAFVWADTQNADFFSSANDQVSFRCIGGVRFTSGSGAANQTVSWAPGSGSWTFSSDRALKEGFEPVNIQSVLERVAGLPISEWNYKGYPQRHIGVMAQDFHAVFPFNESTTTLNEIDLHGVALAAIQGLNQKVQEQAAAIKAKDKHISDLERRVERLEKLITNAADKH